MALTDKLTAIGDAIRGKTGGTEPLTLDQMATEIANIQGGGGGGSIDFNIQSIQVADSASTPFFTLTLEPDSNKNNIWFIPLRPNTSNSSTYIRWLGYPGVIIKLLNQQPYLKLFDGSITNSYSPWFGSGFSSLDQVHILNEDENGNVILSLKNDAYPAEHNLMWKITF